MVADFFLFLMHVCSLYPVSFSITPHSHNIVCSFNRNIRMYALKMRFRSLPLAMKYLSFFPKIERKKADWILMIMSKMITKNQLCRMSMKWLLKFTIKSKQSNDKIMYLKQCFIIIMTHNYVDIKCIKLWTWRFNHAIILIRLWMESHEM